MFDLVPLLEAAGKTAAFDASGASDDELLVTAPLLEQARRMVDAALGSALGELDRRGTTDARFGHRTATWFAIETCSSRAESKRRVQVGRRLARLEAVRTALADGDVSFDHVRVLTDLATPRNSQIVEHLQSDLLALAAELPFERWRVEAKGLVDLADPDGGFRPGPEASSLRMTTGFGGSLELAGTFTSLDGAALRAAVESGVSRLRLRYREEVRAGTRDSVPSQAELMAESLCDLVRSGVTVGSGGCRSGRGPAVELTLIAHGADPLGTCATAYDHGDAVPAGEMSDQAVRTLCCDPVVRAVVLDSLGNPVDLGRTTRIVPKGLRRAIEIRDGGCIFPGCDAPPAWCDLHHVHHWADGGSTSADNLASLCRHHHGTTHRSGWAMAPDPSTPQRFTWTRPDGVVLRSQRASDLSRRGTGPPGSPPNEPRR